MGSKGRVWSGERVRAARDYFRPAMRNVLVLLVALLPFVLTAQTIWRVDVGGSTLAPPAPYYSPQHLTILVGDSVVWTNVSGTHNVIGSTDIFPGNPVGFSSGTAAFGTWTFGFRFTVPGLYNYHCTQVGHAATQFGTITVTSDTRVGDLDGDGGVTLFPVPTGGTLVVETGAMRVRTAEIYSLDGQRVLELAVRGAERVEIGTDALAQGQYFLRLVDAHGRAITRPFRKE